MVDDKGSSGGPTAPHAKDSRQDRLKSALRENLKRRKVQARERDQARDKGRAIKNDMPSSDDRDDDEPSPDGELGKRGD